MWFWIALMTLVMAVVLLTKALHRPRDVRYRAQHGGGIGRGADGGDVAGDGRGGWGWGLGWGDDGGDWGDGGG
jgi:hypothetical protein